MAHKDCETCSKHWDEVKLTLKSLDESIRGNGKPGLKVQVDRNTRDLKGFNRMKWLLVAGLASLGFKAFLGDK